VKGERGTGGCRRVLRDERGQVVVLFALALPMLLALGAVVLAVGNWYTHAKHLQTKVDAAAFAGGASWGFPCGADIDANIEAQARMFVGSHTAADGTVVTSPHNPQLSGVDANRIYTSLNQAQWWSGSFPSSDFSDPLGPVCQSKILDVKATQQDAPLLWRYLPFFPDIKRKARVQIEEIDGLTGLLPIAVRLPQPLSAAAVFYDEETTSKPILGVAPLQHVCIDAEPFCFMDAPPGLGQWTTGPTPSNPSGSWADFFVRQKTGVVIATSVRPACGAGTPPATAPCLDTQSSWVGQGVNDFCRQAATAVQCFDADGSGATQTVASGIQLIRGHLEGDVGDGPPDLRNAWIEPVDCPSTGYFNSLPGSCTVRLGVVVDIGSLEEDVPGDPVQLVQTRIANHVEMRYCLVKRGQVATDICASQFGTAQDMSCTGGPGDVTCTTTTTTNPLIALDSRENSFAIQVRLRRSSVPGITECNNDPASDYHNNCRWFFTSSTVSRDTPPTGQQVLDFPVHRSFMGHLERTGPLKWLRLTVDKDCDPLTLGDRIIGRDLITGEDAASQQIGEQRCYAVDLGMAGGLAQDQDEPPIAFNLGDNSSQRAYVDCDPDIANLKSEILMGCQWPPYAANKFDTTPYCPGTAGFFDKANPPMAGWPPYRCVLTQTGNSSQVIQGFNERIFNKSNNPNCPNDNAFSYVKGRNYWHRLNNDYDAETFAWDGTGSGGPGDPDGTPKGNTLRSDDPRLVTLFFTTYDSFTSTGNEVYPIVGFGNFYVTGYGETINGGWKGGRPEDPCDDGNGLSIGAGNTPPPDIDMSRNTRWVWGHFVKDVTPAPFTTGGSGVLCNPEASFQPCVAVLVE
jgi:Putative Flp pilus-assembly TadE/G-like